MLLQASKNKLCIFKRESKITLVFDKHTDIELARLETASIIRRNYPTLPKGITYPSITLNQPDNLDKNHF